MPAIFVSKSGTDDEATILRIAAALRSHATISTEDDFRLTAKSLGYSDDWGYQFRVTRASDVMLVVLRGPHPTQQDGRDMSQGQEDEIFDAAWRGIPIVWTGTTDEGLRTAQKWYQIMSKNHPCLISHFFDARNLNDAGVRQLAHIFKNLISVEKPTLPHQFLPSQLTVFTHQISEAHELGWRPKDISTTSFRPVLRIEYGSHILKNPYAGDVPRSPVSLSKIPATIVSAPKGLIEVRIAIERAGVGELKLVWETMEGEEPDWCPFGSLILHWDFTCGSTA